MKFTVGLALVGVTLVASLTGCAKSPEKQLEGKWVGSKIEGGKGKAPDASQLKSLTIEFKADKSFTASIIFPIEGTWTIAADSVTINPTKVMGQSVDKLPGGGKNLSSQFGALKLNGDGKELRMMDAKTGSSLVFVKEEPKA